MKQDRQAHLFKRLDGMRCSGALLLVLFGCTTDVVGDGDADATDSDATARVDGHAAEDAARRDDDSSVMTTVDAVVSGDGGVVTEADASVTKDGSASGHDASSVPDADTQPDARVCVGSGPPFAGPIGVVGCSNTAQAVDGYLQVSTLDLMINTAQWGQAMTQWKKASGGPWTRYEQLRPAGGFSAVWLNLCQPVKNGLSQGVVDTVIANIRSRDPSMPIIISPLNFYVAEDCMLTGGNQIPNAGKAIADATAANDPMVFRGPDLGPLSHSLLDTDYCHLNDQGISSVGKQLADFFDHGIGDSCNSN